MKVLLYCTKAKPYLHYRPTENCDTHYVLWDKISEEKQLLNGKVVASFDFDRWEEIKTKYYFRNVTYELQDELLYMSKLTQEQLKAYGKGKDLYAYYIDNLQVFDEPIELGELYVEDNKCDTIIGMTKDFRSMYIFGKPVTKAPQSYMYVYYKGEKCLLLSVKSEWVYKILNGEKTVEIRKTLPKEVKENV